MKDLKVLIRDRNYVLNYLNNYHESDIANMLEMLDVDERMYVYDVISYLRLLLSFDNKQIGSYMTNNFVFIYDGLTIKEAMSELIKQAGKFGNILMIYVVDRSFKLIGAINLKDLIVSRENDNLDDLIKRNYPYFMVNDNIDNCLEKIIDYADESIPVLNDKYQLVGIITSKDIIEMVDDEISDDYAKLAGLTEIDDLSESLKDSMKKRLPWLIVLLILGMFVSSVVGIFENVVAIMPIVICF